MNWQPTSNDHLASAFGPLELARLSVYRAAVQAGFFTDSSCETSDKPTFSETELARLAVYRAAIRAGFYTDADAA